jgi:hypothetical protein
MLGGQDLPSINPTFARKRSGRPLESSGKDRHIHKTVVRYPGFDLSV